VALNVQPDQDRLLPEWRAKGKYTFPIVLSSDKDFAQAAYGVTSTPTSIILNADGKLVFRHLGYATGEEMILEAEIRELLGLDPFASLEPEQQPPAAQVKKH
jgi:hypothetical protein